jgi:CheY-like chemotaxis protein
MKDTLRILVADDDPSMAKTLADICRVKGYEAETTNSGARALDRVMTTLFDCVLSDIRMPEIKGAGRAGRVNREN